MDAVDAVLVQFSGSKPQLLEHVSTPLPDSLRKPLLALARPGHNELDRLAKLDSAVARLFAKTVQNLLHKAGATPHHIRAIGSHGQTVRHAPGGPEPYTVQLGNPSLLAELTNITTVADFRRRDMAAGGQGAPLAPAFHAAFFRLSNEARVIVNIGGMANITILPASTICPVKGFDTGPGNVLLDAWATRHLGVSWDHNGVWGGKGEVLADLLDCCLCDPYFALPPPKSTGREYFNLEWLEQKLMSWGKTAVPQDIQATLVRLTAYTIAADIRRYAPETKRILICGGGVHNQALMLALQNRLSGIFVQSTAGMQIDPDYLEAMGFAWLAKQTLAGLPGNLPEVTGARGLRILGGIYPAS
jgi:anhydro-N-acetylmuramic acid kinase